MKGCGRNRVQVERHAPGSGIHLPTGPHLLDDFGEVDQRVPKGLRAGEVEGPAPIEPGTDSMICTSCQREAGTGPLCVLIPEYPAGGDFAKSYWMARIAGYSNNYIANTFISPAQVGGSTIYVPYANNTFYAAYNVTLYNLMFNSEVATSSYIVWAACLRYGAPAYWVFEGIPAIMPGAGGTSFKLAYIAIPGYEGPLTPWYYLVSPPPWAQLVYVSRPYGWVIIYKINYGVLRALARNQTLTTT